MSTIGDVCGPAGESSYGLLQIKNQDCSGAIIHGGYPHTMQATALNVDWYAAHLRSCYDGDFYDGGNWLYLGQNVDQIAAQHGWTMSCGPASAPTSRAAGRPASPMSCQWGRFSPTGPGRSRASSASASSNRS
jgi:hypothetical protein